MIKLVNFFKKPVVTVGALSLALVSGAASANFDNLKFYAGAGLDYIKHGIHNDVKKDIKDNGDKLKDKGMGLLIPVLGVKFHENFGMEVGYSFNKKIKIEESGEPASSFKVRNAYLDFMGFMPVCDNVELVGGLGLGRLMVKKPSGLNHDLNVKNKFGLRIKAGAQYNFTTNFGVRALVTYQQAGTKLEDRSHNYTEKFVKNMKSVGMAAIYSF